MALVAGDFVNNIFRKHKLCLAVAQLNRVQFLMFSLLPGASACLNDVDLWITLTWKPSSLKMLVIFLSMASEMSSYRKIPRMSAKTVEGKINPVWKRICNRRNISKYVRRSFTSTNTDLPRFYHLIKTHKLTQAVKIRPIVSNFNGPTTRLSCLLARTLRPLLKHDPAHLENSLQLIDRIQQTDHTANQQLSYLFSLDVVALYTSVPVNEAINIAVDNFPSTTGPLTREDIKDLLTVILHNTYFCFNTQVFLQIEGLPMGSSLSGILAILFMDSLECGVIDLYNISNPYDRYVDIYSQASDEKEADTFHSIMNSAHPRILFEIEKPNTSPDGRSLSLLDFTVTIGPDGNTEFEFYKKKAKKPICINYKSAIPKKTKRNIIRNKMRRIDQRCSNQTTKENHQKAFIDVLSQNDYPRSFTNDITPENASRRHHEPPPNNDTDWLYLGTPYISDAINRKITNIFKDEGFPVRVVHSMQHTIFEPETPRRCCDAGPDWTPGCCSDRESGGSLEALCADSPNRRDKAVQDFNESMSKIAAHTPVGAIEPLVFQLPASWDEAKIEDKKICKERALDACQTVCEFIVPKDGNKLFQAIQQEPRGPTTELIALMCAYRDAQTRNVKRQILSIYAYHHTMKKLQAFHEPYEKVSMRQIKLSRLHAKQTGLGSVVTKIFHHRVCLDTHKVDHFVEFINRPYFYQDVTYGTRKLSLDGGSQITMPNVIRTVTRSTMVMQYLQYCKEESLEPISRSTMYQILEVREASQRTSLCGLDNTAGEGASAFF
ncbi:Hypothetical predicted protein [Paramuricea clavata]|uniref:Uncharacterized protein n=1 Tax=Paramuricea clavata TaxID=317549 RepID=A0A6S7H4L6_PARCT|nr:Hypothetical predicted protein [Paramuricea clavata]